jgi:hypothetical protein
LPDEPYQWRVGHVPVVGTGPADVAAVVHGTRPSRWTVAVLTGKAWWPYRPTGRFPDRNAVDTSFCQVSGAGCPAVRGRVRTPDAKLGVDGPGQPAPARLVTGINALKPPGWEVLGAPWDDMNVG